MVSVKDVRKSYRAPANCVQYFTGTSGNFQSYNHQGGVQLADQEYKLCFRQELGKIGFGEKICSCD